MFTNRKSRFTTMGLALLFAIGMVSSGLAKEQGFTTIDVPGASLTQAFGINNRGQIVGRYIPAGGRFLRGYVLDHGTFTTIDVPFSTYGPIGINARGDIVGTYQLPSGNFRGFVLSHAD